MKAILTVSVAKAGRLSAMRLAAPISALRRFIIVSSPIGRLSGRPPGSPSATASLCGRCASSAILAGTPVRRPGLCYGPAAEGQMRVFSSPQAMKAAVGSELGASAWVEITQDRIDRFAEATGDHQWIHVDPERARRESPFGATVAHGYLTL